MALIMAEVARRGYGNHHTLAYQSRVGPVEWLQPYTDDSIRCVGGCVGVLVCWWVAAHIIICSMPARTYFLCRVRVMGGVHLVLHFTSEQQQAEATA